MCHSISCFVSCVIVYRTLLYVSKYIIDVASCSSLCFLRNILAVDHARGSKNWSFLSQILHTEDVMVNLHCLHFIDICYSIYRNPSL